MFPDRFLYGFNSRANLKIFPNFTGVQCVTVEKLLAQVYAFEVQTITQLDRKLFSESIP